VIAQARIWWDERSERERWMLGIMFALIGTLLFWFAIVVPIATALVEARLRHEAAVRMAASVSAKALALKKFESLPPPNLGGPPPAFAGQTATEAGLTLTRADPVGADSVAIAAANAQPGALLQWLASLEARGLFVDSLSIRADGGATVAAEATLRARSK
jgi:general secretion pathway protein M